MVILTAAILLQIPVAAAKSSPRQIENLRIWHSPDKTRVVFDVSADVKHQMFSLTDPLRLVVDIENADLSMKLPQLDPANKHISAVRSGRPGGTRLRFVFELKSPLQANDFVLSPNELYGHRLVVDLQEVAVSQAPSGTATTPFAVAGSSIAEKDNAAAANAQSASAARISSATLANAAAAEARPLLIAIDAGHGGEDPGAVGHRGSREKQITLEIARELKKIVDQDPQMKGYMVRQGDYYIKLHDRRQLARKVNADMFISIHADAFKNRSARGISVFALSQGGATSAMARALAAKENASDLIGGVSLADKDDMLAKVLVDLSMTNTISESVNFGGRVLNELGKLGKLHSKRVEQAGFAVLKSPDIPSILVEAGFITNRDEERKLRSRQYQQKLARAIYNAIRDYQQRTPFRNNANYATPAFSPQAFPASSTKPVVRPTYHRVVRGDSLSKIAVRYGTTVREIKKINNLRRDTAVLGQKLKLPSSTPTDSRPATKARPAIHIVRSGESLSIISLRYNVTIRSLKSVNNLRKDTVYIGQKLKIPGGSGAVSSARPSKAPRTHKVKRGDTLSEIAEYYGSSMSKIIQANSLRSRTVMLGQTLKIPN
ncbi:MAG: LysM peptidoglycan-binding domain-containing protein [Gammaproteobacteria bacterium]|nr:LysM peptidoglycan-binding domain-containing protein [Gammaproteobacteria bacterium]